MLKENKDTNDYNEAPPVTPNQEFKNNYSFICPDPECKSSIEISLIDEDNNIINFRCVKSNKKFIIVISSFKSLKTDKIF